VGGLGFQHREHGTFGKAELIVVALIIADSIVVALIITKPGQGRLEIMEYISAIHHRNYFFETKFKKC
jgi:hypothetical protein